MLTSAVALLALLASATPATPPACAITAARNTSPPPGDAARARTACDIARTRFAELFGEPVPGVDVVLWNQARYRIGLRHGRAVVFWPDSDAAGGSGSAEHLDAHWGEVLPHEITHALLAARFYPDGFGPAETARYGTPLPDWLEEAIAIWAEPLDTRRDRLARARALPDAMLDVRRILTTPHPAAGNTTAYTARDGTAATPSGALWAYYQQAIAVLAFIHDAGGAAAVDELVRRLVTDPDDVTAIAGLPGLPRDFDAVTQAWQDWLEHGAASATGPGHDTKRDR